MKNKVSERALIKRINRRIGGYDRETCTAWGQQLRKLRGERWWTNLGYYYTVDSDFNVVQHTHIDLEEYGREVGALQLYERLAD